MMKTLSVATLLTLFLGWNGWAAEDQSEPSETGESTAGLSLKGSFIPGTTDGADEVNRYELFRPHAHQYYPPKEKRTALALSAMVPGLGQAYGDRLDKGLFFFAASLSLLAVGGFHVDRAFQYNDLANRFSTGFYDPHGDGFLSAEQGNVRSRGHAQLGIVFLAGGAAVYLWNVLDAAKTVEQYNDRRFPVEMQQTVDGETYLKLNRRF